MGQVKISDFRIMSYNFKFKLPSWQVATLYTHFLTRERERAQLISYLCTQQVLHIRSPYSTWQPVNLLLAYATAEVGFQCLKQFIQQVGKAVFLLLNQLNKINAKHWEVRIQLGIQPFFKLTYVGRVMWASLYSLLSLIFLPSTAMRPWSPAIKAPRLGFWKSSFFMMSF